MEISSIEEYLAWTFAQVDIVVADGDRFIFYEPGGELPKDHMFPFATIVTSDRHDPFSKLDREGIFRLNVGLMKERFLSLFGEKFDAKNPLASGFDFSAIDRIMPHPVYGNMYWICVLNPSDATFESLKPMLAEGYQMAIARHPATRKASQ